MVGIIVALMMTDLAPSWSKEIWGAADETSEQVLELTLASAIAVPAAAAVTTVVGTLLFIAPSSADDAGSPPEVRSERSALIIR